MSGSRPPHGRPGHRGPRAHRSPAAPATPVELELAITGLAAGGDGLGRDAGGRVTFVARTSPGDRVRVRLVQATASFARGVLLEVLAPGADRVAPPCAQFARGCGGCQWQHVSHAAQLAAQHTTVVGALRKLAGIVVHAVDDPAPLLGWRRRARFHAYRGQLGLYALGSRDVLALDHCPQLEPALDAALARIAIAVPPDGEVALALGHRGEVVVGVERAWAGAAALVGVAGIVGVTTSDARFGTPVIELEPGLWGGAWEFAQASAAGNAALIARTRAALGPGPGTLLELYAGSGNITRALVADGWRVTATDTTAPARPVADAHLVGLAHEVLGGLAGPYDAVVLDPPRAGAAEVIAGIVRVAPRVIAYVSCDPATLARDAMALAAAGYVATDAWPIDLMPQTAHVEVVLRMVRGADATATAPRPA